MIIISKEQVREIADYLDCGMKCYLNKDTGVLKTIIDFDNSPYADEELWEEILNGSLIIQVLTGKNGLILRIKDLFSGSKTSSMP